MRMLQLGTGKQLHVVILQCSLPGTDLIKLLVIDTPISAHIHVYDI